MKKHLVQVQFDAYGFGWLTWTGLVPDEKGKCVIYPNQIFKRLTGQDMPPHTRIIV